MRRSSKRIRHAVAALLAIVLGAGCGEVEERRPGGSGGVDLGAGGRGSVGDGGSGGTAGAGGGAGSEEPGGSGGGGSGEEPGPSLGPVVWTTCTESGVRMKCAEIDVPLDWSERDGERISFFVRKIPAAGPNQNGQLWFFVGGPGYSASDAVEWGGYLAVFGYDVYLPDYRGVGSSTPLACEGEAEGTTSVACYAELLRRWGDGLRQFSTTSTAMDIGKTIEAIREPGEKVFVLGGSYGSFLANRYMSLFPDQADAVSLEGICPATGCAVHQALNANRAAHVALDACGGDAKCSEKLSSNPWSRLEGLRERLREGHCPEYAGEAAWSSFSKILVATLADRSRLPVGLAAIYRLDRCDPEDVTALRRLEALYASRSFGPASVSESEYLFLHIVLSEFWEEGLTPAALRAESEALLLRLDSADDITTARELWTWPLYETPAELRSWAPVTTPVALFNGAIDRLTPTWDLGGIEEAFPHPGQSFVEIPLAGHGALFEGTDTKGRMPCGLSLVLDFFEDPLAPLDLRCVEKLRTFDFRGSRSLARQTMGTDDLWENP
ncbi:alpha/beta fold hydrolase [Vulgatibacter incomptus]|nr:alpha/beta fold hydrolase [Vulgatibacter incomptus]